MVDPARKVVLGRISGVYGVQGWVRIHSDTRPREGILNYSPWYLGGTGDWRAVVVRGGRLQGKGLVARIEGVVDRDQARALMGLDIAVRRDQLPPVAADEVYWSDLEGLEVVTLEGVPLGRVRHLFETGANDVLVVCGERERLIPLLWGRVVADLDLEAGRIRVDWDPDF